MTLPRLPLFHRLVSALRRASLRQLGLVGCAVVALGLAGCAGSVAPPTVVTALPSEQKATLRLAKVTTEAGPGALLTPVQTDRITGLVVADLQSIAPGLVDPAAMQGKALRIVITRYDVGNAAARFMLAGLGQIRLDGDVLVVDPASGQTLAAWKVAKQFSFGGLYGGLTSMEDVEKGFSKSVAALFKPGS